MERSKRIQRFIREIWRWYALHKRDLPWRDLKIADETERAYRILVSEVMLQQTQVDRVKIMFKNFLKQFPKIEDLARASNRDVLIAWRGMGYNARALQLRDAAREIATRFLGSWVDPHGLRLSAPISKLQEQTLNPAPRATVKRKNSYSASTIHPRAYACPASSRSDWCGARGPLVRWVARGTGYRATKLPVSSCPSCAGHFPHCMPCLLSIKGIGPYTAAAIRNFAFGIPTPCLDTNIRRVLHRTFIGPENPDGTWKRNDRYLLALAEKVLEAALKPVKGLRGVRRVRGNRGNSSSDASVSLASSVSSLPLRTTAEWHAALMDFGSLVQTKTNPRWDLCPLTRRGLMKARPHHFNQKPSTRNEQRARHRRAACPPKPCLPAVVLTKAGRRREPGRTVGSRFIPNRIFRGRIVEELRDVRRGLGLPELGRRVCSDWKPSEHRQWLQGILQKLERDALIQRKGGRFALGKL